MSFNVWIRNHNNVFNCLAAACSCTGTWQHFCFNTVNCSWKKSRNNNNIGTLHRFDFSQRNRCTWIAYTSKTSIKSNNETPELKSGKLYQTGIIMNVTNPKVSIFFLAFLPQFTSVNNGSITVQIILLGLIFIVCALFVFSIISHISGAIGRILHKSDKISRVLNKIAGTVFLALALKLVFTER